MRSEEAAAAGSVTVAKEVRASAPFRKVERLGVADGE
jgi:hypothetical protein